MTILIGEEEELISLVCRQEEEQPRHLDQVEKSSERFIDIQQSLTFLVS